MDRKVMLWSSVGIGGLVLLWASHRTKAAEAEQAAPDQPSPDDERAYQQQPPQLPASLPPAPNPAPNPPPPAQVEVGPVESHDPPEPSLPAPKPVQAPPPVVVAPPSLPPKRPFGDQPLDVNADASNVAQTQTKPATPPPVSPAPAPAPKRSAEQAAKDLLEYVTPILRAGHGSELGVKNAPNAFVKAAQIDMGAKADGIYGPDTRARGKKLLGVTFPART